MRDLGVLKERIEYAERHLKAAHSARERESEALMAMWKQIRDRFEAQEKEIGGFREEVAGLTKVNDELSALVDRLISTVEGNVDESENETVPEVTRLAGDLLKFESNAGASSISSFATAKPRATAPAAEKASSPTTLEALEALETDDPLELGTPLDEPTSGNDGSDFAALLDKALEDEDDEDFDIDVPEPVAEASASIGIRDLVARIETSVKAKAEAAAEANAEDDELARELREIESLRTQLSGLQDRISEQR